MTTKSDLLMLSAVAALCADCGDERLFLPVDDRSTSGEFCCSVCDAAVFLLAAVDPALMRTSSRVA
jgi:hypothetical protein